VAAAAAAVYLVADPPSADLAAQRFRTDLFEREGFTLFSTAWYGGHHTPGYSVLFPPLAALLGPRLVAALAAVAATAFVAALCGERGRVAGIAFVPGIVGGLVSGRLAFTLGAGLATGAVLAAARGRTWLAALAGLLTALASPVAAAFAALAGVALAAAGRPGGRARHAPGAGRSRSRAGVALAAAAVVPVVFLVVAFPEGGTFPFVVSAFLPTFAAGVAVAVAAPREWRAVRIGAALYALLALAAFAIPTPLGGNAARLGTLFAAPVAILALWPRRRAVLAALALPIAYWALQPAVRDWLRAHDDPSTEAAFYDPVAAFLTDQQPARVAIPFTQSHGEAFHLARRFSISRGWERQVDIERNALFYEGELTAAEYDRWLQENGIALVAVPLKVPMDASGEAEKRIALTLREVFRSERWRVVVPERAGTLGPGVVEIKPEGFVLNASQPGANTIRVRFTPYWELLEGKGCVEPAPGGWTRVRVRQAGRVEVGTRFALGRVRAASPRCTD
jgi:MFS family permease